MTCEPLEFVPATPGNPPVTHDVADVFLKTSGTWTCPAAPEGLPAVIVSDPTPHQATEAVVVVAGFAVVEGPEVVEFELAEELHAAAVNESATRARGARRRIMEFTVPLRTQ